MAPIRISRSYGLLAMGSSITNYLVIPVPDIGWLTRQPTLLGVTWQHVMLCYSWFPQSDLKTWVWKNNNSNCVTSGESVNNWRHADDFFRCESLTWISQIDSRLSSILTNVSTSVGFCGKHQLVHSRVTLCHLCDCQSAGFAVTGAGQTLWLCDGLFHSHKKIALCLFDPE